MNKKTVSAVVLAAGKSLRMGENKLLMPLGGKPILEHVLATVSQCDFCDVTVVFEHEEAAEIARSFGFDTALNDHSHLGQSSSIVIGTKNTNPCGGIIFIIGDQPFISTKTMANMLKIFGQNPDCFVASAMGKKRCSPVIFPYVYREDLLKLSGDTGGREILKANSDKIILCECENPMECFDVDTAKDYAEANEYINNNYQNI